jgi:hypothetical protein
MVVIGGAAIGMFYAPGYATFDLDSTSTVDLALQAGVQRARVVMRERHQLEPAEPIVQFTFVMNAPHDFEDRLLAAPITGLSNLQVVIPERHDLALMKTSRGQDRDLDALAAMHAHESFDLATLVERYEETRQVLVGRPSELKLNFLALVERLFGADAAESMDPKLRA